MAAHGDMNGFLRACNAADGFVYILTNESLPGLIKIGYTDRRPDQRAVELHTTGVPTPFKIAFCFQHISARSTELAIHDALSGYRISSDREFFRCDVERVVSYIIDQFSPEDFFDADDYACTYEEVDKEVDKGVDEAAYSEECEICGGSGKLRIQQGFFQVEQTCPSCRGRGKVKP